jgi:hypothetical protein
VEDALRCREGDTLCPRPSYTLDSVLVRRLVGARCRRGGEHVQAYHGRTINYTSLVAIHMLYYDMTMVVCRWRVW